MVVLVCCCDFGAECYGSVCVGGGALLDRPCMVFQIMYGCFFVHTMWSGKNLQLLCILPFGMLCLSAIGVMFVKIMLAVCMLVLCWIDHVWSSK